eukprot:2979278-Pyramimonas_sp.AAC.2
MFPTAGITIKPLARKVNCEDQASPVLPSAKKKSRSNDGDLKGFNEGVGSGTGWSDKEWPRRGRYVVVDAKDLSAIW